MHFNVKENNGQRLYEIQFDDEEQSKDFSIDEQLYEELFNMSANIQLNILQLQVFQAVMYELTGFVYE